MKYLLYACFFFFFKIEIVQSQNIKIQEIKLEDTHLKKTITNFIENRKKEFNKFETYGYITVSLDFYNKNAKKEELSYVYSIKDQYVSLKKENSFFIPLQYTYIKGKIVLLYNKSILKNNTIKFSKNSKNKFIRKVNKFLKKKEHLIVYNSKGEKVIDDKDFISNEEYNIHGGIVLKIFANNSIIIKKKLIHR